MPPARVQTTGFARVYDAESIAEDESPEVSSRRLAEEALMSAMEFESLWVSNSSVRGKINGEEAARAARASAGGGNTPRRRRGYKPTASDLEREEKAKATAESAAHPAASLFDDA